MRAALHKGQPGVLEGLVWHHVVPVSTQARTYTGGFAPVWRHVYKNVGWEMCRLSTIGVFKEAVPVAWLSLEGELMDATRNAWCGQP